MDAGRGAAAHRPEQAGTGALGLYGASGRRGGGVWCSVSNGPQSPIPPLVLAAAQVALRWPGAHVRGRITGRSGGSAGAAAPPIARNTLRIAPNALTLTVAVRVRIAPSPTGDPHVGTAYIALFNAAMARQQGGQFVLRVEDTDRGRYVENSESQIFDLLHWLGFEWDEGPDRGGPFGPYPQSERLPIYQAPAERLLESGHAYYCWCTPERLDQMRPEQTQNKQPPGYDRRCLGMTRAERAKLPGFDERPVIRMRVPDHDVPLSFDDLIRGPSHAPMPDDQVLLKKDGFPTYHLAVVVDDHEMGITHVLRAEEWISSMPKQLLLYRFFGWHPPRFAHLPVRRNRDRRKIRKRQNPAARLLWFQEEGFLPEALVNFLALQGWSMPDGREIFTFDDVVTNFDVERFSPVGPIFDVDKLDSMNGKSIEPLSHDQFLRRSTPFLPAR